MTRVYIDPGHGGNDPGAVGHGLQEKDVVLKISHYAREYLESNYNGVLVRMSRTGDTYPSLTARANDANSWGADVFVSIHINAFNGVAHGYEDFIFNGNTRSKTERLQDNLHTKIAPLFRNNRGKKRGNFAVLRQTRMPAVLTENGFIDNKQDADFLSIDSNLKKIGEAHANGIASFFNLEKKAGVSLQSKKEEIFLNPTSPTLRKKVEDWLNSSVSRGHIDEGWLKAYREGELSLSDAFALKILIDENPASAIVYEAHKEAWKKAEDQGVMNGERPNEPLTRSEFATVANRVGLLD